MLREAPDTTQGLVSSYVFNADGVKTSPSGDGVANDRQPAGNHLQLRSNPPEFVYSYAPLTTPQGAPVAAPQPGAGGYALALHDKQVRGCVVLYACSALLYFICLISVA